MIADSAQEHITELWAHLFEGLTGYLVTFTGEQSDRPDAGPNELDDTRGPAVARGQVTWRWSFRRWG
jgi:hypothetical protein